MNTQNYDNEGTLWMGDLDYWMDESFIMNSFIQYGFTPINVKLIIDKRFHKNQNFCFVTFNNLKEANNALFQLNRKKIPNSNSYFKLNLTKKSSENKKIIFVGNLPQKIGENELYRYFKSKYSSVISACVLSNNDKSKGYGFVNFTDETDYQNCLKEMDGKLFNNRKIKVKKKIISKEKNNKNKNFYFMPYFPNDNLSYLKAYNQNIIITDPNFFIAKDSTISKDKENNSISLNRYKKKNFLDDIKLLESNDNITLKKLNIKIQESFDKMIDYYKKSNKIKEIPKSLLYYASNQNL